MRGEWEERISPTNPGEGEREDGIHMRHVPESEIGTCKVSSAVTHSTRPMQTKDGPGTCTMVVNLCQHRMHSHMVYYVTTRTLQFYTFQNLPCPQLDRDCACSRALTLIYLRALSLAMLSLSFANISSPS